VRPPSGTVTFLFTDVEGSSSLWERQPAAMGTALRRHDELLRSAIEANQGLVFAVTGDGLAAVFSRAGDAVAAALEAQVAMEDEAWPDDVRLRVRMALHTGEAEERDGNYFGDAVNRTARLMELAGGGQVVLSTTTAEVVRHQLPQGTELVDHGLVSLRSLAHPEHVVEVLFEGRGPRPLAGKAAAASPRSSSVAERHLIGRDDDLAAVQALLVEGHLVTLTGVGGVGKTSLAFEVSGRLGAHFADGVWVAELAEVGKGDDVPLAMMELLSLRPQVGVTPAEAVVRALAQQDAVLLLDNCEHVVDVVALLAADVLRHCPGVRVLATSREPLGVAGERTFDVHPLPPGDGAILFAARLGEHHARFGSAATTDPDVVELCRRLDGLPLAIELAAARARSIPIPDLLARLGDRFRLLRGPRTAASRHQTLRETVAWSYELLTSDERVLFDRLSVFSGGFTLAAAEAVAADDELDAIDVDDLVASLADKSMIVTEPGGRYLVLETLRQFGEDQLSAGVAAELRDRHLAYFTRFVADGHDELLGPDEARAWRRLQQDWANVRAAFTWACTSGDIEAAAAIATRLTFAALFHDTSEPYTWIVTVATLPGALTGDLAADVLAANAWAAWERGELHLAADFGGRALAAERPGRPNVDYFAEFALASAANFLGDTELAWEYVERAIGRAHAAGAGALESIFITAASLFCHDASQCDEGIRLARKARAVAAGCGNPNGIVWAMTWEAAHVAQSNSDAAIALFEDALVLARVHDLTLVGYAARRSLGELYIKTGSFVAAAELLTDALGAMRRKAAWMFAQQTIVSVAELLARQGDDETASALYGSVRSSGAAGSAWYTTRLAVLRDQLRDRLGPERFDELADAGDLLPVEHTARLAEDKLNELLQRAGVSDASAS
jgi:predicted ATPase/class 3 adenylate cyclase